MNDFQYQKLANILGKQIDAGLLSPGSKLPSIRALCTQHNVAKNTVIHALQQLERFGLVQASARRGYYVSPRATETNSPAAPTPSEPKAVNIPTVLHDIMRKSAAFDVLPHQLPIVESTGIKNLHKHLNRAVKQQGHIHSAYYDNPKGNQNLREALSQHYVQLGVGISYDDIVITAGCQQAISLSLQATCCKGDTVLIESPGFYGALQLLEYLELNVIEIPSDPSTGINIDSVSQALKQHNVTACIVTPSFATPSGALMPDANKKRLVELANEHDIALIEDDIYGEVYFSRRPTPLKFYDTKNRVITCSSFSKSLSRDLRIGWVMGARWHDKIIRSKLVNQLSISQTPQVALNTYIRSGDWRRHLQQQRQYLLHQRDQLLETLQQTWDFEYTVTEPVGGLCVWLGLPEHIDTMSCYAVCKKEGIIITPGSLFSTTNNFDNYLRISFNHPVVGARRKAVERIGQLLRA